MVAWYFWAILALSTGVSYVQTKKAQKEAKKLADSMAGVLITQDSTIESVPVIYGERRVGGHRVFIESSTDEKHTTLYMAIVLSEGEVESIDLSKVWLDDKPLIDYAKALKTLPVGYPVNGISIVKQGTNDEVYIEAHLGGDNQAASSILSEAPSWGASHKLSGLAYLAVRLKWNEDAFDGVPNISVPVKGKKVYDARQDSTSSYYAGGVGTQRANDKTTWEYSDNAAICMMDYMKSNIYGKGIPDTAFDEDAFYSAADDLDTFTVTPYVGATGTQRLFKLNAVVDTKEEIFRNIERLMLSCRGFLPYSNGQYQLKIDQSSSPVMTITEDMIIGGIGINGGDKKDRFNIIEIKFPNKAIDYQPDSAIWPDPQETVTKTSFPDGLGDYLTEAQLYAQFVAEDNGYELRDEVDLDYITDYYAARDMARILCLRSREQLTVTLECTTDVIDLVVGDVVNIQHPTPGWTTGSTKPFQIDSVSITRENTVKLTLIEYTSSIYAYDPANEERTYADTNLPNPFDVDPPEDIAATSASALLEDGTLLPRMSVTWTATSDAFVTEYELRYKLSTDSAYDYKYVRGESALIEGIKTGIYDVGIRSVNSIGAKSSWSDIADVDRPDVSADTTAPDAPTSVAATGGVKSIELTWDNPSDADFKHVEVYVNTTDTIPATPTAKVDGESYILGGLTAGNTRYFWLKSVDFTGNKSDATVSVNGTAVAVAAGTDVDVDFANVTGTTKPADNATKNTGALADKDTVGTTDIDDDSVTIAKIANSLQSTNYVAGVSGWKLTKAGAFEAGDAIFRGSVTATNLDLTGSATIAGSITATSIVAGGVTYDMLSPEAVNELQNRIGNGSAGDFKTASATIPTTIILGTFTHGTKQVETTVNASKTGYHYQSYTLAQRTVNWTIEKTVAGQSNWGFVDSGSIVLNQFDLTASVPNTYYHTVNYTNHSYENDTAGDYTYRIVFSSVGSAFSDPNISVSVTLSANEESSLSIDTSDFISATATGTQSVASSLSVGGDLSVTGDLNITGNINSYNVTDLDVTDTSITLNAGGAALTADGAGIYIEKAVDASTDASITWDATNDEFDFSHNIDVPKLNAETVYIAGINTTNYTPVNYIYNVSSGGTGASSVYRPALVIENHYGTHSWGTVLDIAAGSGSGDLPSMRFVPQFDTTETGQARWSLGYVRSRNTTAGKTGGVYDFRITQDHGYDAGTSGGWGTDRLIIDTSGNVNIPSGALTVSGAISASGYNNSNWNTAYTYSQVGHLPLSGGQMSGVLALGNNKLHLTSSADGNHFLKYISTGFSGITIDGPQLGGHQGGELVTNYLGNNWSFRWNNTGNTYSRISSQAPIFYDIDNTSYYTNPADWSYLNYLSLAGHIDIYGAVYSYKNNSGIILESFNTDASNASQYKVFNGNSGNDVFVNNGRGSIYYQTVNRFVNTGNHYNGHFYYDPYDAAGNHYPHFNDGLNQTGAIVNWRIYRGANLKLNTWTYDQNIFHTRIDCPIYYDSDNAAFYFNGAGDSYLNRLFVNGGTTAQIGIGQWDGTNNRIESTGRDLFLTTYTGQIKFGRDGNLAVGIEGNGAADSGVNIYYGAGNGDYGRLRFYRAGSNEQTIHAFNSSWQGGSFESNSAGAFNISGYYGTTFGAWNNPDMYIRSSDKALTVKGLIYSPIYYDYDNNAYYLNPNDTSYLNKVTIGGLGVQRRSTVDLTGLDQNTYYPVIISLPSDRKTRIRVDVGLNSGSAPSWSTHGSGFTLLLDWTSNGSGWGTSPVHRETHNFAYSWTNANPCGGIGQLGNGSAEYVMLRGGGRYYFYVSDTIDAVLYESGYSYGGQSISPTTDVNATSDPWNAQTKHRTFVGYRYNSADGGYITTSNPWGTGDSAWMPNGITTPNVTSWMYGTVYLGNAPSNGSGTEANTSGLFTAGVHDATQFRDRDNTGFYCDPAGRSILNEVRFDSVASTTYGSAYHQAAIGVREYNWAGTQSGVWAEAPRIGFHWGGRVASSIAMATNGWIYIMNNPGDGYESLIAGAMYSVGDVTAYYSDVRLKNIVGKIENAVDKVKSIETFFYTHNDIAKQYGFEGDDIQIGVSAQSVEAVLPEVVKHAPFDFETKDDEIISKSGEWYKTVKYERIVPLLIEAIKEQQEQIEELKQIIKSIKEK